MISGKVVGAEAEAWLNGELAPEEYWEAAWERAEAEAMIDVARRLGNEAVRLGRIVIAVGQRVVGIVRQ